MSGLGVASDTKTAPALIKVEEVKRLCPPPHFAVVALSAADLLGHEHVTNGAWRWPGTAVSAGSSRQSKTVTRAPCQQAAPGTHPSPAKRFCRDPRACRATRSPQQHSACFQSSCDSQPTRTVYDRKSDSSFVCLCFVVGFERTSLAVRLCELRSLISLLVV